MCINSSRFIGNSSAIIAADSNVCAIRCFPIHGYCINDWSSIFRTVFNLSFTCLLSILITFFNSLGLFFMPAKYHPPETYVRRVPTWKMHLFTVIQVIALIILWVIKSSKLSLAFPFVLIMMVPLRQRLSLFFNSREINAVS